MARILYGVCGEGMGHAIRSSILIKHLKNHHDIYIVAGNKAYAFLNNESENVVKIESPRLMYDKGEVNLLKSMAYMIYKSISSSPLSYKKVRKIIKEFQPDLVISDAEPICHLAARISNIKRMSIDNPHVLVYRKYKVKINEIFSWFCLLVAVKISLYGADKYIIYDYFSKPSSKQNVIFLKPLIQEGIIKQKPSYQNHIFVYQTSVSTEYITDVFRDFSETFVIYGFNRDYKKGNIIFKKFNENEFFADIATAKAVITNGGFTAISEALFLKKPIFSLSLKSQFEQILNGRFIEKLGVGVSHMMLNKQNLSNFLKNLETYKQKLQKYDPGRQEEILNTIDNEINKIIS